MASFSGPQNLTVLQLHCMRFRISRLHLVATERVPRDACCVLRAAARQARPCLCLQFPGCQRLIRARWHACSDQAVFRRVSTGPASRHLHQTHVFYVEIEEPQWPIWKADVGRFLFPSRRVRPCVHESLVCVTVLKEDVKYRVETTEDDMDARLPPERKHETTLK